jgi:hypothetical protein
VGYVVEDDGSGSCAFEVCNPEQTAVVSEHLSPQTQQFGEYAGAVVVVLPDVILWTIEEHIPFDRVSVEIEEEDKPVLEFGFEGEDQLFQTTHLRDQKISGCSELTVQVPPA